MCIRIYVTVKLTAIAPHLRPGVEVYFSIENQKDHDDICLEVTSTFPLLDLFHVKTVPKVLLSDLDGSCTDNLIAEALIASECLRL